MSLRIIGGAFRRRKLATPHGLTTRPYTDRVRQIVFDRLSPNLEDARVADVFSGVGTMGLESISRGAKSCVFFEADRAVHECLEANVKMLTPNHPTMCWKTDIHRTSFCPKGHDECMPYNLVFFDPPYPQCPLFAEGKKLHKSMQRLSRPRATTSDAIVLLRTPDRFDLPELDGWEVSDLWPISSMKLWLLRKPSTDSSSPTTTSETAPVEPSRIPPDSKSNSHLN